MRKATMTADRQYHVGEVADRLYGSYIEPMGSCVYNGFFEPQHPTADEAGFRKDVIELVKELGVSAIRFPGGNFTSGYDWQDTIGPVDKRPTRLEFAWQYIETNRVGIHEYYDWIHKTGAEPIMTINLGTGTAKEACRLVEYMNYPKGTTLSDLRIANGRKEPFNIRTWCLGNELDGEWQINHKTATEYGRIAAETARLLHTLDPKLELVAVGSSHNKMPSFPEWDREVLLHTYKDVQYLALHKYLTRDGRSLKDYLAMPLEMEAQIQDIITTCDYVKSVLRSNKTMSLSFDEYMPMSPDPHVGAEPWTEAGGPWDPVCFQQSDALVFAMMMMTLMRHCDRVKIGCQAILVNVVSLIMTKVGGPAWRNTTFYPLLHASRYGRGTVLKTLLDSPMYNSGEYGDVEAIDHVAVYHADKGEVDVFAVNRADEPIAFAFDAHGFAQKPSLIEHIVMDGDTNARNTAEKPETCVPRTVTDSVENDGSSVKLTPYSWNVLRYHVG